ncbi:MAG: DUF3592 domain-containing protein [Chloroherpetonaceae bacterium]|nr:DUF3592 domain-containing protein [Chloroherpetonaceae bacterium]
MSEVFLILFTITIASLFLGGLPAFWMKSPISSWAFIKHRGLLALISFLILIGASLVSINYLKLKKSSDMRSWAVSKALILTSEMKGKKAFIPFVTYEYNFLGKRFTGETELYAPQFGSKETRKKTSNELLKEYSAGNTVEVFINPSNPKESALQLSASWQFVIQLGVGFLLFSLFLPFFFFRLSATIQDAYLKEKAKQLNLN